MTLDWSKVVPLAKPIQTSTTDVVSRCKQGFSQTIVDVMAKGMGFCIPAKDLDSSFRRVLA